MSKINVNTWEPESSTALTMGASGDTTTVPSGASLVVASGATINITGATQTGFPSAGFSGIDETTAAGSTTYTVPTDITKLVVYITGGGGGGGGGAAGVQEGTGGNSATTVIARVTVVAADTITIAVGAGGTAAGDSSHGGEGGDSTFTHATGSGSFDTITAPGGEKGTYVAATARPAAPVAGTVGASNEGISVIGAYGNTADRSGGPSFWGGGGLGAVSPYLVSKPGVAQGSGGGAGQSVTSYTLGAAGGNGVCLIMEYK